MFSYLNSEADEDYSDSNSAESEDSDTKKGWKK